MTYTLAIRTMQGHCQVRNFTQKFYSKINQTTSVQALSSAFASLKLGMIVCCLMLGKLGDRYMEGLMFTCNVFLKARFLKAFWSLQQKL